MYGRWRSVDVVAPAARGERVPGRSRRRRAHATLCPHMTTPPPRLSRRTSTSLDAGGAPAARAGARAGTPPRTRGSSRRGSRRPRASRCASTRPASGRPTPTYSSQAGRASPPGTPNSSEATTPPGRTTRASSASVAPRIVDVAQEVRDGEVVERRVRRTGAPPPTPRRARRRPPNRRARAREHLRALVDAGDPEAAAQELGGDEARFPSRRRGRGRRRAGAARRGSAASSGSWPNESTAPTRSYVGPSGANSSLGVDRRHDAYCGRRGAGRRARAGCGARAAHAGRGDAVSGVLATEPPAGTPRLRLLDRRRGRAREPGSPSTRTAAPVTSRVELRAAVSIAALCEVAADAAGGGDLDGLHRDASSSCASGRRRRGSRTRRRPRARLRDVVGEPPQLATRQRLDEIGVATRRLEQELEPGGASPFAAAMKAAKRRSRSSSARSRPATGSSST